MAKIGMNQPKKAKYCATFNLQGLHRKSKNSKVSMVKSVGNTQNSHWICTSVVDHERTEKKKWLKLAKMARNGQKWHKLAKTIGLNC